MPRTKPIIPCEITEEFQRTVANYTHALKDCAHKIGDHGLSDKDFWESGIFHSAIERLRGTQSASMTEKRKFMDEVLTFMQGKGKIIEYKFCGSGERHDYEVRLADNRMCAIETKGCLDGNNTNIFERPANADEFIIWSLCQNFGADPRRNAWSGMHTRLSAELIHRKQRVDGVVFWDMQCGSKARPCPRLSAGKADPIETESFSLPPPCIYLFPRTIPDPRNNPAPDCWKLDEVKFLSALASTFKCPKSEVASVRIEARMNGSDIERRTKYFRSSQCFLESNWTIVKRASR